MKQSGSYAAAVAAVIFVGVAQQGSASDKKPLSTPEDTSLPAQQADQPNVSKATIDGGQVQEILAAHDKYRHEVGDPPLRWSISLASSAQKWANHLLSSGQFAHSSSENGENLAECSDACSFAQFVDMWGQEKKLFVKETFPNVSRTGNWPDVGHYTQLVWKNTSEVGCGLASSETRYVFVCQYNPAGNIIGQPVF